MKSESGFTLAIATQPFYVRSALVFLLGTENSEVKLKSLYGKKNPQSENKEKGAGTKNKRKEIYNTNIISLSYNLIQYTIKKSAKDIGVRCHQGEKLGYRRNAMSS